MSKPYKALVSLTDIKVDGSLTKDLSCVINAEGVARRTNVPFTEVECFDLTPNCQEIGVTFYSGETEVASGQLIVPVTVREHVEVETTEKLSTKVYGVNVPNSGLTAVFNLTFINSNRFNSQSQNQQSSQQVTSRVVTTTTATETRRSPTRTSNSKVVKKNTSTTKQSGGTGISNLNRSKNSTSPLTKKISVKSKEKSYKYTEDELHSYLNRVVEQHGVNAEKEGADLAQVSDCLYLNKFSKMAQSELINPALIQQAGTLHQSNMSATGAREQTDLDQSASPEKLRNKFQSGKKRGTSPSPMKAGPDMTSLLMDTETRRYVNEYKNQLEYLRNIVYALDLKLRAQEGWQREALTLREQNNKGNAAREELRKTLLETTSDLKEESQKFNKVIMDLESHNQQIVINLRELHDQIEDLQNVNHGLEIKNAQLENENNEQRIKLKAGELYKKQLEQARADYLIAEKRHVNTLNNLAEKIRELENGLSNLADQRKQLQDDNNGLRMQVSDLNSQLVQEKSNNADLSNELDTLNKKLKITQTSVELLQSMQDQRDAVLRDLEKVRGQNDSFAKDIAALERDLLGKSRDFEQIERRCKDDLFSANARILNLEAALNEFKSDNSKLKKENIELRNHIITLEQLLCVKEDVYGQLQAANERLENKTVETDGLRAELEGQSKVQEKLDDKIYELEKCLIYLKNASQERDEYILNLKKLILEMKDKSAIYIAVNDDSIDRRLAEFINASNDPTKLTKLFLRERDGVYQFGTKRVYVKTENDKCYVRVGGGFLSLDEFLRINVPIELEKMARCDPITVLTKNMAISKVVAGRSVNEFERSGKISPLTYKNALQFTKELQ